MSVGLLGCGYPFDRRLVRPQSRSGLCGEETDVLLFRPGIELRFPGNPTRSLVTVLTVLCPVPVKIQQKCECTNIIVFLNGGSFNRGARLAGVLDVMLQATLAFSQCGLAGLGR
jgi:hypothetical protein